MTEYTPVKVVRWNVLYLMLTIARTQGALLLISDKQYAQLHGDITLICNTSDSVTSAEFKRDTNNVVKCTIFNCETENKEKFDVKKTTTPVVYNIFTLTVKDFDETDEGLYTCVNSGNKSQYSEIYITYAVDITSVTLTPKTDPLSVIEYVPQHFRCVTSTCRPVATVMWFLGSTQLTFGIESNTSNYVTTSTLEFTPQKNHTGMILNCRGDNGGQLLSSDDEPRLNVLYGPSEPVCKHGGLALSSTVAVREGWEFRLDCSSDGNPSPSFSWTHPGDGPSYPLFIRSINRTHAGIFRIQARNSLIPSNQQAVNLTKDINITVDVQYPPDPPNCRVGSTAISDLVSAIRGNTITISCSCDSNPPSRYSWSVTGVSTPTSGQSFDLLVQNATTITFTIVNSMQFTNRSTEQGRRESSFDVKILYPPSTPSFHFGGRAGAIIPDNTLNVIRGKVTTVICESSANPPPTYTWNGNNRRLKFKPTVDENKTCIVRNSMVTTEYGTVPGYNSSVLKVNVLFAPTVPTFHFGGRTGAIIRGNFLSVIRGNITSVTCESTANPMPAYTWNGNNRTWTFTPTDDENRTCTVRNSMVTTRNETVFGNNSSILKIKILYPPSTPSFHFGVPGGEVIPDNTLYVSRGNITSVICRSSAHPPPTYTWNENNHTLTFKPTDDENRTCIVYNSMVTTEYGPVSGYNSSVLSVSVLYPPGMPDLSFPSCLGEPITVNTSIKVIQGQPVNVTCSASSRPAPIYSWSRYQSKQSNVMWIPNAKTSHQGTYTCKAENIMDITFGGPIGTNSSKHFHLKVLIPPMVNPLKNVVVLERGNVSVVCQVTDGFPNKTEFKWERMSDMTSISMEQTLSIDNIDRKQGGNYTCTASNLMRPTGCNATVGNSSNTVNVDVQYEAEVTNFTVSNFNHGQYLEVDENTQVIFYCQVQSNPLSNISMLKETQDLKTASHSNDLEFTISKSVCEDEGTYQCSAQNVHNTKADIRSLTLFVRCAPRASSLAPRHQSITRSTGVPAVFALKLVAFPRPRVADIIWEKNVSDHNTWVIVRNDTGIDILISEDGLQTQLSFSSVKENDFGYYRVHVNNELGNYTESFSLQAQGQPSPPTELRLNTLDNTVTFEWKAGFNGGHAQTFVLETSLNSGDSWTKRLTIKESESKYLNKNGKFKVNLPTLDPGVYNARLVALNIIGATDPVEFKKRFEVMNLIQETLPRDSVGPVIGGTVGGIMAALVVVIVVVVILRRKYTCSIRFAKREDQSQSEIRADIQGNANTETNASQTSEVMAVTRDTGVYTDLKNRSSCPENMHLYMPLDESSSKSDVYYQNVKKEDPVYNNTVLTNSAQTEL